MVIGPLGLQEVRRKALQRMSHDFFAKVGAPTILPPYLQAEFAPALATHLQLRCTQTPQHLCWPGLAESLHLLDCSATQPEGFNSLPSRKCAIPLR